MSGANRSSSSARAQRRPWVAPTGISAASGATSPTAATAAAATAASNAAASGASTAGVIPPAQPFTVQTGTESVSPSVPHTGLSLLQAARLPLTTLQPIAGASSSSPASPSAGGAPPLFIASPSLTLHVDHSAESDSAGPIRTPVPVSSSHASSVPIEWGSVLLSESTARSSEEPDRSGAPMRLDRRTSLQRSPSATPAHTTTIPPPQQLPPSTTSSVPPAAASIASPSATPRADVPASSSPTAANPSRAVPSPRINKALLSAQAFAKQKSASVLGLIPKNSSSAPSLVPGINDSPPQRNRSLGSPRGSAAGKSATTPKGTPMRSPAPSPQKGGTKGARSQSVFASLFSGPGSSSGPKDSPRSSPNSAIAMAPLHSKSPPRSPQQSAADDEQKNNGPAAAASSVPSAVTSPLRRVPSAQKIRIVPSPEERGRSELGLEGQPPSPGSPPFKPALRLKQASTRTGGAQGRSDSSAAAKKRAQLIRDRARDRARAHAWTCDWAAVSASLRKERKLRPVIGGKFAIRPTFKYLPLNVRRPLFFIHSVLHSMTYQALLLLSVLVALFATDFLYACFPGSKGMDAGTGVMLFSIFIIWVTDAAAHVALHSNYSFCIYMWFDLLAILSLVVDLSSINGTSLDGGLNRSWHMDHASHSFYALATNSADGLSFLSQFSLFLTTLRIVKVCRSVNLLSRKLSKKRYELSESRRCLGQGSTRSLAADSEEQQDYFSSPASPDWSHPLSGLHKAGPGFSPFPERRDGSSFSTSLAPPPPSQLGTILSDTISLRGMMLVVALGLLIPILFVNAFGGLVVSHHAAKGAAMHRMADVYTTDLQALPDRTDTSALDYKMSVLYDNFIATYSAADSSTGWSSGSSYASPHRIVAMQWTLSTTLLPGVNDTTVAVTPPHSMLPNRPRAQPPPITLAPEDAGASADGSRNSRTTVLRYPDADNSPSSWRGGLELQRLVVHSASFQWNVTARDGVTTLQANAVYSVYATFDSRPSLVRAAWLHLLFTLCLLGCYLLHTGTLVHSTSALIIHPFERIVGVVWSLTKSLGIVKQEEQYRSKNYGSTDNSQDSIMISSRNNGLLNPPTLSLPSRLYRDVRSLFMPCKIRAYELRLVEDMISKLCKIFLLTPASRSMVLTRGEGVAGAPVGAGSAAAASTAGSVMAGSPHKFPDAAASSSSSSGPHHLSGSAGSSNVNAIVASRANNHLSKSIRMLTGTRITEIQTPHTILTVHVSERPLDRELKGVKGVPQSQPVCVRNYGDQPRRRNSLSSVTNLNASGFEEFSTMMVSVGPSSNKNSARHRARSEGSLSAASSKASQSALAAAAHVHAAAEASANRDTRDGAASIAHASIQSAMQSSIVAGGLAVGLHTAAPRDSAVAPLRPRTTGNKAAQLLGLSGSKLRPAGFGSAGNSSHAGDHPELASLDSLLLHPLALTHFRSFLSSKFCVEIFLFYIQVLRFQREVMEKARWIERNFIVVGSPHEVNIPQEIRNEIQAVLAMEGGPVSAAGSAAAASSAAASSPAGVAAASVLLGPSFSMFDRAKAEIVNLLRGSFQEFMNSDAVMHYLAAKMESRVVLRPQMDGASGRGGGAAGGEPERM